MVRWRGLIIDWTTLLLEDPRGLHLDIPQWHPTPVLLPGKSHGWRSLVGYSPWGREESDTTERFPFYFSLSCIGEGNGNSLQCSCLENPRDGGTWWAAIYGVTQSWTRLKWFSSSSRAFLVAHLVKNLPVMQKTPVWSLDQEDPLEKGYSTPVFLPGKFHGQSLAGYSPWGPKELDKTEWLSTAQHSILLIRWGTLFTLFKLSELRFSYLQNNDNNTIYFTRIVRLHILKTSYGSDSK